MLVDIFISLKVGRKMDIKTVATFAGKKIKIDLKNGFYYVGEIKSIIETDLIFLDKHDNEIAISSESISTVKIVEINDAH